MTHSKCLPGGSCGELTGGLQAGADIPRPVSCSWVTAAFMEFSPALCLGCLIPHHCLWGVRTPSPVSRLASGMERWCLHCRMGLLLPVQPGCLQAAPKTPSHVPTMSGCSQTVPVVVLIQCRGALSAQNLGTDRTHLSVLPPGRAAQELRWPKLFLFPPKFAHCRDGCWLALSDSSKSHRRSVAKYGFYPRFLLKWESLNDLVLLSNKQILVRAKQ